MKERRLNKAIWKTMLAALAVLFLWGTSSTKTVEAATVSYGNTTYSTTMTGPWNNHTTTIYSQKKGYAKKKLISLSGNIYLSFAYGDYLCFEKQGYEGFENVDFWKMNVKTLKRTKVLSGVSYQENYGRYVILMPPTGSPVDLKCYVCNILTGRIKRISRHCIRACYSNKKLYYIESDGKYPGNNKTNLRVRCCSVSGASPKYVSPVFRADGFWTLNSKYVEYSKRDSNYNVQWYRYTYATKKTKKIPCPY